MTSLSLYGTPRWLTLDQGPPSANGDPACGPGTPFLACFSSIVHSFLHLFLLFTFPLFLVSFALPIFFFCPFLPFLPE